MSQKYKVVSGNLVGLVSGDTITGADLPAGTNVAALVAGGHLVEVAGKAKAEPKKAQPKADPAATEEDS